MDKRAKLLESRYVSVPLSEGEYTSYYSGMANGALAVSMPASDPIDQTREQLVRDLPTGVDLIASCVQAGAVRWVGWAFGSVPGLTPCLRCVFEDVPAGYWAADFIDICRQLLT